MLVTADRGVFSYALWRKAIATNTDLLWRVKTSGTGPLPRHVKDLPDGSWLAELQQTHSAAARRAEPMLVR
ncbi:IS4 family transposase, partial [Gordonia sp. i37]